MKKIRIRKNVPIPETHATTTCSKGSKYPFDRMKVGDSIVVESKACKALALASQLRYQRRKKAADEDYVIRILDCANRTAGIWRVR